MNKAPEYRSPRDRFIEVARQVQTDYQYNNPEALAQFIVSNMQRTFGVWWQQASQGTRRNVLAQLGDIVKGEAL